MTVGFDRIIRLEWLEIVANCVAQGKSLDEINSILEESIARCSVGREGRRKTRTVLLAIWAKPSSHLVSLRDRAVQLLPSVPRSDHLILHWGMSMATYPFFSALAGCVGRLLRLQGSFPVSQVQLRLREQFGDRQTVSRAVQRLLRSFFEWKVIETASEKGVYTAGIAKAVSTPPLVAWLVEAALLSGGSNGGEMRTVLNSPALFPVRLAPITREELVHSGNLEVVQHGPSESFIRARIPK